MRPVKIKLWLTVDGFIDQKLELRFNIQKYALFHTRSAKKLRRGQFFYAEMVKLRPTIRPRGRSIPVIF